MFFADALSGSRRRLVALLGVLVLLLASCGDSGSGDATESFDGETADFDAGAEAGAMEESPAAESASADAGDGADVVVEADGDIEPQPAEQATESEDPDQADGGGGPAVAPTSLTAADLQRDIVFTAQVSVAVDDVSIAGQDAVAAIDQVGGFVFGQDSTGGSEATSTYVFKVLPQDFEEALAALSGLGELTNQTVSADDVTEKVVDLQSRIAIAELGVERLRTAAEATTSFEDFSEIETLLLQRETELELMRGQLRTLQDQVNLATITLVLTQDRVQNNLELLVSVYQEHDAGLGCPGQQDSSIEAEVDLTVCFELINSGDQTLTDLTLIDTGLGIDADTQLISVFGSLNEPLLPGQSIIVAFETTPERDLRLRTRAGGQPTVIDGAEPAGPPVSAVNNLVINVRASEKAPGFDDGFSAGSDVLSGIWVVVRVAVGFLIPMLVFVPILIAAVWIVRRVGAWRTKRQADRLRRIPAPGPAPSAPTPTPVGVSAPTAEPAPPQEPLPPPPAVPEV